MPHPYLADQRIPLEIRKAAADAALDLANAEIEHARLLDTPKAADPEWLAAERRVYHVRQQLGKACLAVYKALPKATDDPMDDAIVANGGCFTI